MHLIFHNTITGTSWSTTQKCCLLQRDTSSPQHTMGCTLTTTQPIIRPSNHNTNFDWSVQTTPKFKALYTPFCWRDNPLLQPTGQRDIPFFKANNELTPLLFGRKATTSLSCTCSWPHRLLPPPHTWPPPKRWWPLSVSCMETRASTGFYSCWDSQATMPLTKMAGCYRCMNTPHGHGHVAHTRALSLGSPINSHP